MPEEQDSLATEIALIKRDIRNLEILNNKLDIVTKEMNELSKLIAMQAQLQEVQERKIHSLHTSQTNEENEEKNFRSELRNRIEKLKDATVSDREEIRKLLTETLKELTEVQKKENDRLIQRITALENWKWWIMGMGVVIASIVSYIWKTLFSL